LALSEEVKRQLWLAGPLIAGNLLQNLIPVISVMLVGHLGELPLAGASLANSFATVTGFSLMVRTYPFRWRGHSLFFMPCWLRPFNMLACLNSQIKSTSQSVLLPPSRCVLMISNNVVRNLAQFRLNLLCKFELNI
jgi:MATE family multidrug resistance protein